MGVARKNFLVAMVSKTASSFAASAATLVDHIVQEGLEKVARCPSSCHQLGFRVWPYSFVGLLRGSLVQAGQ